MRRRSIIAVRYLLGAFGRLVRTHTDDEIVAPASAKGSRKVPASNTDKRHVRNVDG